MKSFIVIVRSQPESININKMSMVSPMFNYSSHVDLMVYIAHPVVHPRELITSLREAVLRTADNAIHVSIEVSVFIQSSLGFVHQLSEL